MSALERKAKISPSAAASLLVPLTVLIGSLLAGYGQTAFPLALVAAAWLVLEVAMTLAWRRPLGATTALPPAGHAAEDKTIWPQRDPNTTLVTTEARYRAFFDYAEDSLCDVEVTPDGRFLCIDINPHAEAVMGTKAAAVRGLTPEQILGPEAGGRLTAALTRCMEQNGLRYEETWATVRGPRLTDTIMVPLRDRHAPSGPYVRILCSMRDITDKRQLEMQLVQGQKLQALGQLAGGIAHDFNNVLQAIEGGASLISRRAGDRDAVARLAHALQDATSRGSSITRRLLTFARRDELRAEAFDATALLLDLREVLASTLGANISVCIDGSANLPSVQADKGLVESVLVNLATNARDAMPRGGTLTLGACADNVADTVTAPPPLRPGAYVRFDVTDTGDGMDAATLARAAEPFFTTKPRGHGTGLGLSMARGFAEQSGGALALSSVEGEGTKISFWLPQAARVVATSKFDEVSEEARQVAAHAPRVLVVDDDPLILETVCETLQLGGYNVVSAADAAAALPLVTQGCEIDLLLTDFSMPGLNGVGLIREAQRYRPALPAILMTGYAGDVEGLSTEKTASARFVLLRKPVSSHVLFAQLAALLPDTAASETASR